MAARRLLNWWMNSWLGRKIPTWFYLYLVIGTLSSISDIFFFTVFVVFGCFTVFGGIRVILILNREIRRIDEILRRNEFRDKHPEKVDWIREGF